MEDVSKVIEIAIGAILFMIAITLAIIIYSNMLSTAKNALYINNIDKDVVNSDGNSTPSDLIMSKAEVIFMIKNIKEELDNGTDDYDDELNIIVNNSRGFRVFNRKLNRVTNMNSIYNLLTSDIYSTEIEFKYIDSGAEILNNHSAKNIIINNK